MKQFKLYVFEEDKASSLPSDEVFINEIEQSDIYIGLIGQHYGNIYKDGISATEYEYNVYTSKKHDDYFFIYKCDTRDEKSQAFLDRILELFKNVLEDSKIKELFDVRELDKILEYIGAGKIDYNDTFHLNKAGALFFSKDITKFDIEHEIKMVRFNGIEPVDIIDKLFSYKSFFKLIEDFNNFFDRNTRLGGTVKGWKKVSIPEYPIEAVREAFINAIAHRDYTLTDGCITFYIYDDRIEIVSPGKLPFPLTVEKLGIDIVPRHRNKKICRILEKTKYMEHIGTGITRMRHEMHEFNLPEPEFINEHYFKVILRGIRNFLIFLRPPVTEIYQNY